jgi:hypothetical protein
LFFGFFQETMVAKLIISSSPGPMVERRQHPRRRRKSKSRIARDHVKRLDAAWLMDIQDSYSDTAR